MKNQLLRYKELILYIILNKEISKKEIELINSNKIKDIIGRENNKEKSIKINENKEINIQKINKLNNWRSVIYKFNKSELINTVINDKILNNLINKIFKIKTINKGKIINKNIKKRIRYILIDNINIKHYINKIRIDIFYHTRTNKNNSNLIYYNTVINRLINLLTNEKINKSLINILKIIYKKDIKINLIYIKYYYLNSNIFIKKIKQEMKLRFYTLKGRYIINLGKSINIPNSKNLIKNYKLAYNNYINKINNLTLLNNKSILNKTNKLNIFENNNNDKEKLLYSLLLYKYIGGLKIMLKGKLQKTGRTKTQFYEKGIINNNLFKNTLDYKVKETFNYSKILNYHNNYISTSKINYNSKFGTRNLKTSFNYI